MSNTIPKIQRRDPFFDSLKVVQIFFVVFGHALLYSFGEENILRERVYMFILSFNMPLFIFTSGYFTKNISMRKYKKSISSFLVTYIIFQTIFCLPDLYAETVSPITYLLSPKGVMWYIPCLIIWRLLFCIMPKKNYIAPLVVIISFVISFLAGFYLTGNMLTRVCTFLPYFALGFYCTPELIQKVRNIKKIYAALFLAFIFFALYEFAPKAFIYSLYGDVLYSNFMVSDNLFSVTTIGAAFRIISYGLAITISCAIICLVPNTFARWGDKTLYVYLLHAVFVYLVYYYVLSHFEIQSYVTMHFIVTILLVCIIIYLSKFRIVQCIVDPVNNLFGKKK